jgi:hypothetical protein
MICGLIVYVEYLSSDMQRQSIFIILCMIRNSDFKVPKHEILDHDFSTPSYSIINGTVSKK